MHLTVHLRTVATETATLHLMDWLTAHYDAGTVVATDGPLSSQIRTVALRV